MFKEEFEKLFNKINKDSIFLRNNGIILD